MLSRDLLDDNYCQGVTFSVEDVDALARAVALVLVQEFALARQSLAGEPGPDDDEIVLECYQAGYLWVLPSRLFDGLVRGLRWTPAPRQGQATFGRVLRTALTRRCRPGLALEVAINGGLWRPLLAAPRPSIDHQVAGTKIGQNPANSL